MASSLQSTRAQKSLIWGEGGSIFNMAFRFLSLYYDDNFNNILFRYVNRANTYIN
jgi:hypothetical protein